MDCKVLSTEKQRQNIQTNTFTDWGKFLRKSQDQIIFIVTILYILTKDIINMDIVININLPSINDLNTEHSIV